MKKALNLLSGILIVSFGLTSQNITIAKGVEYKNEDKLSFDYYIGNDETGVYIQRSRIAFYTSMQDENRYKTIQKLDAKTLTPIYTVNYDLAEGGKLWSSAEFSYGTFLKGNKILVFTTKYDKETSEKLFLLREFDSSNGKELGGQKIVASINIKYLTNDQQSFHLTFSPDETKMAITSIKLNSKTEVSLYETNTQKKKWTKPLQQDYKNSLLIFSDYKVDDNGDFYYLFKYNLDLISLEYNLGYGYIAATQQKSTITPLALSGILIENMKFEFANDNLVLCGLFKDVQGKKQDTKDKKSLQAGIYSVFINKTDGGLKKISLNYFTNDIKEKLTYKVVNNYFDHLSPIDKSYMAKDLFTINNNIYLIESHIFTCIGCPFSDKELIITKFKSDGTIDWMKIIPKNTRDDLQGYNYIINNNKICLFYAENSKNLRKTTIEDYEPKNYHYTEHIDEAMNVCTIIEENGNITRKAIFSNEGAFYIPTKKNILLSKDNNLIIRIIKSKRAGYDKVERYDVITID